MTHSIWVYLLVMSAVTLAIRILPLTLIRRQIKSRFLRSFLFYVPYITLAVMTFPDIIHATQTPVSGFLALVAGAALAWFGASLFKVSALCCVVVFLAERVLVG
ncbi:MAG: AzlD domain-containing protein [Schwartzia sp.]|nr:AzlD domain-containing protein [Schwartzia sp. (in: firmicutes)]